MKNDPGPATPKQGVLDLGVEVERVVGGVEMGVLDNGIPYLTQRGLAAMAGAARSTIQEMTQEWQQAYQAGAFPKGRMSYFAEQFEKSGYNERSLYIEIIKDGSPYYAYPDVVCMAIIEYFAFEAQRTNDTALASFRGLARSGLQHFIYRALGYKPVDKWQLHHERVSLLKSSPPDGHWIVFNEISGLIVDLITAGLSVNGKVIPDISVGQAWALKWEEENYAVDFGNRKRFLHNYPPSYAQSASNPQPAWAYPDASLSEFRRWFRHEYLITKFPRYILTKANVLPGGKREAERISSMYQPPTLPRQK
jgi:hypothetical protein